MSDDQQPPAPRRRKPMRPPASRSRPQATAEDTSPEAAGPPAPEPEFGRVRVYPRYTFPLHGAAAGEQITVTDWLKQGSAWAEAEAKRQVTATLGPPSGVAWWLGRAARDQYRWLPLKGTPRDQLPDEARISAPWSPAPTPAETASVPAAETETVPLAAMSERLLGPRPPAWSPAPTETETAPPAMSERLFGPTAAETEERFPPAEQATRYAARRSHHEAERGTGRRARNGYRKHKAGCATCSDIDRGGDGTGRPLRVLAPPANADPAEKYPVKFTFTGGAGAAGGDDAEIRHWAWEQAMDALRDQVGGWVIPDDGTGVLDTDSFIASIGGYVGGLGEILGRLAEELGGGQTPIAAVVGEAWADFATALGVMSAEAAEVYARWTDNEDNAHDLRRARGEIKGAELFNVSA